MLGVHSSLSRLGRVEGGAEAVLEALFETVGPGGTIVMQHEAEALGMIRRTTIGRATARCFEAAPMVELYRQLLIADPYRMFGLKRG